MVSVLLLSTLLGLTPVEASGDVLGDSAYAFCHEPDYPLTPNEAQWCPVLEEAMPADLERCPAFAKACDARRAVLKGAGRLSSRSAQDDDQAEDAENAEGTEDADGADGRAAGQGPSRDIEEEPEAFELPVLGGFAEVLFWLVIGLALVFLAVAIMRNLSAVRAVEPDPEDPDGPALDPGAAQAAAANRAMETDVERLLSLARESAKRGAFSDAVDFSHAALLRRLDHEGLIRLHASRTNGEYVRELRGNASLVDPVRDVLRRVDRAQFGPQGAGSTIFDDIHARVIAIVKTVGPLVLLLTTLLGAGMACDTASDRTFPWSTSPSGNEAVIEVLRREGVDVSYRMDPLTALGTNETGSDPVLVMLEDASATEEEWEAVRTWVDSGGTLIVAGGQLPPWLDVSYAATPAAAAESETSPEDTAPSQRPQEPSVVDPDESGDEGDYDEYGDYGDAGWDADAAEENAPFLTGMLPLGWMLVVEQPAIELGVDAEGNVSFAGFSQGLGRVDVFADGRFFTNAALLFAFNAEALIVTLQNYGRSVEFVDGWASKGADTPADTIRNSHLTAAVIQLLLLMLAFYLWRGRQFGRGRDPIVQGRRSFAQHAVAMGRQYEKARAASFAARLFSGWVLERLRNRFSSAASAGLLGLSQEIARRSGRDETEVMRLLVAAHSATDTIAGVGGTGEDLALVRDLGRLMREIGETT